MAKADLPRGIRNNNPGNIRATKDPWQGLDSPPSDGEFFRCKTPADGIRMLARTLITYQDKRLAADGSAIDTVQEVIARWAPPAENDTDAYAESVRKNTGIKRGEHIDLHDYETMDKVCRSIILHENGVMPYTDAQITKGLVMAGIEPPKAAKSRTMRGAYVAGGTTVLGMAGQYVDSVKEYIPIAVSLFKMVPPWALGALALIGIGWIMWARFDDRRKGLR